MYPSKSDEIDKIDKIDKVDKIDDVHEILLRKNLYGFTTSDPLSLPI